MKISRLIQHRWFDDRQLRRALDADALRRLEAQVAQSERQHRGEIRLCVEAGLPLSYLWRDLGARDRAVTLFGKLRDRLAKADKGDLVRITGRVRQTSYEAEGSTRYGMDMIADGFAILAKASGKPADEDAQ